MAEPGLGDTMAYGTGSPAEMAGQSSGIANILSAAFQGLKDLSQRAVGASEQLRTEGTYNAAPAFEAAQMAMGGPLVGGLGRTAGEAVLGSGPTILRPLPLNNFTGPMSRYTPELYRDTAPGRALELMPGSNKAEYRLPYGQTRLFFADHPDMALGQGSNTGVQLKFDAAPFEGRIHKKPGWEIPWQQGYGEYEAGPAAGQSFKGSLLSADVNKDILRQASRADRAIMERTIQNLADQGWRVEDIGKLLTATRP